MSMRCDYKKMPNWSGREYAPMALQSSIRRMSTNYGVYAPQMRWSPSQMQAYYGDQVTNYGRHLAQGVLEPVAWPRNPFQPSGPGLAGPAQDVLAGCACDPDAMMPPWAGRGQIYQTAVSVAGIAAATFLIYKAFLDKPRRAVAAPQIV